MHLNNMLVLQLHQFLGSFIELLSHYQKKKTAYSSVGLLYILEAGGILFK